MAKFIQIQGQVYKIPNKITIGRGEPFTVLNGDRSVSRAHATLIFKDGKWYLKNLNDSETIINGNKTKSKKFVEIHLEDEIFLGKSRLHLLAAEAVGDYITVRRSVNDISKNKQLLLYKWLFVFFILIDFSQNLTGTKNIPILDILIKLGVFGVILAAIYYFIKRYAKKIIPKEIVVSEDGFTIHFHNDSNMTYKQSDIKYWTNLQWLKSVIILTKKGNARISTQDHKAVLDFLTKNVADKKGITPWWKFVIVLPLGAFFFLDTDNYMLYLVLISIMGVAGAIEVYCGLRYEKEWKVKITSVSLGMYLIFFSTDFYDPEPVFRISRLQSKCTEGDSLSCNSIDYYALEKDPVYAYSFDKRTLAKACESQNKSACHYLNNHQNFRKLSSEKAK